MTRWLEKITERSRAARACGALHPIDTEAIVMPDAGVNFTISTDQGPETADLGPTIWGRMGRAHFERMEALQYIGTKPMDILIAATRNGAFAYGLGERLGSA